MKRVVEKLRSLGKTMIITSDMYLGKDEIKNYWHIADMEHLLTTLYLVNMESQSMMAVYIRK